ncbi:LysR family transcriptional regulator [Novosphingobium sp.]|uniref:LysR family transcriptional regulator n=1 Tax=Novosphingobium sp. TaxID=1874826 RepID=UPI0028B13682|nr:LysR family transcriptional regulator [Novosphingobium sp.]
MVTLRQIEALHWIEQLGTFERAASRLNTTQSAISKRVQELEATTGLTLFDRGNRGARLTEHGEELLSIGREMLVLSERIHTLRDGNRYSKRRLRLGVTELTAWTWLPRLVTALLDRFPGIEIHPDVDMSRSLQSRLLDDQLDLIIVPRTFLVPEVTSVHLAEVENAWMARPGLVDARGITRMSDLARHPIIIQGEQSGSGLFFSKWLRARGIDLPKTLSSDSLMAVLGLTAAGLGVTYLPVGCFQPMINEGKLAVIHTDPVLPRVPYSAMFRVDRPSEFLLQVAEIAQGSCDFTTQLQSG